MTKKLVSHDDAQAAGSRLPAAVRSEIALVAGSSGTGDDDASIDARIAAATGVSVQGYDTDLESYAAASTWVALPTGVAATDKANIAAAVNAVSAAGGGTVNLRLGSYAVTSAARTDTAVSYTGSGSSYTWTDTSITSGDVGRYVIGPGINGRSPKIVSVTAGTGFVTDMAPGGTVTAAAMTMVAPGVDLPDGVTLVGRGAGVGNVNSGAVTGGTRIVDSGNGCTIFNRGGNNFGCYFTRGGIVGLTVAGSATYGQIGSTLAGVWINNNASFFAIVDCELTGHLTWGLGLDYNVNSLDCRNTGFTYCGNTAATAPTGAVGAGVFNTFAGAAMNFYNCWGYFLHGFFVAQPHGTVSICMYSTQWNVIQPTAATDSGSAIQVSGSNSVFVDCWSETTSTYDLIVTYGLCTLVSGTWVGSGPYAFKVNGDNSCLTLLGITTANHTTGAVFMGTGGNAGGVVAWNNCLIQDPVFVNGGPTIRQALGSGSWGTGTIYGNGGPVNPPPGMLAPCQTMTYGGETFTIVAGSVTQIAGTAINGTTPAIGDRILIPNAPAASGAGAGYSLATAVANGIYVVTGNTTNITVQRAADMSGPVNPSGLSVYVIVGTTWLGKTWFTVTEGAAGFVYGTNTMKFDLAGGPSGQYQEVRIGQGGLYEYNGNGWTKLTASASTTQTLTLPSVLTDTLVSRTSTDTLTNKSINWANNTVTMTKAQLQTALSDADVPMMTTSQVSDTTSLTPAISDAFTYIEDAGLTGTVTLNNHTGTPGVGYRLWVALTGTASRTISYGTGYEDSGNVTRPTTTSGTARLDIGFVWNPATSKFRCVAWS